ncbi:hypothetical protein AX17_006476 [Amanita inopinata Kibby_2008]|nr:hypothetical protein AX17_006476 [Amanita inopinata Kibby_2008]
MTQALTPTERIRDIYQQTDEISFYTHDERQPGARILDLFASKITFSNMHHPPHGSDLFIHWLEDFKHNIITTNTIFTDGSFHKSSYKAAAAFWVPETSYKETAVVHASSSFDTEIQALEMAITYIAKSMNGNVTIYTDSKSAIQAIFNVSNKHQFMECSIRASNAIREWVTSEGNSLTLSWCPAHVGIPQNEHVDKLARNTLNTPVGRFFSSGRMRNTIDDKMFKAWNLLYASRKYRGNNMLPFRCNKKLWTLSKGRRKTFYTLTENDVQTFTCFTRTFSGHAPTGEYNLRFRQHDPEAVLECNECGSLLQSRTHILTECLKYTAKYISIENSLFIDNTFTDITRFLKHNPTAFTFEDIIFDPP